MLLACSSLFLGLVLALPLALHVNSSLPSFLLQVLTQTLPQRGLPLPAHVKELPSLCLHHYSLHSIYHNLQLSSLFVLFLNVCSLPGEWIQGPCWSSSGLNHWSEQLVSSHVCGVISLRATSSSMKPALGRINFYVHEATTVFRAYLVTALAIRGCNCFSPHLASLRAHRSMGSGTKTYLCILKAYQGYPGHSRGSAD